tara:strand:+ start:78 stop:1034 length:957 start_codon:yes stop_codon:yes gene_type:complete
MDTDTELILWKPLMKATIVLYIFVLIFAIFYQPAATILMFAILCLWSRVPCMVSSFTKDMDVIDFFVVIIAIKMGGLFAGIFGATIMIFSRFFGPGEDFGYTIKDSVAFFVGGLMTPFLYIISGENVLITMYLFTLFGRYLVYMLQDFLLFRHLFWIELTYIAAGIPIAYFSNTILVKIFGNSLNSIFESGMKFNFGLFFFITIVIIVFFVIARMIEKAEEHIHKEEGTPMRDLFRALEPHDVILSYFDTSKLPWIIQGSFESFRIKIFVLTTCLLIVFFFLKDYVPAWYEIILLVIVLYLPIHIIIKLLQKITPTYK